MTNQEWKRRCVERITREVRKAGRLRIRELKRRTHYNRGPEDEGIPLWYDALDYLEQKAKAIAIERDEDGAEVFAMTPEVYARQIADWKRASPLHECAINTIGSNNLG
ncbi:MAG: hypothetical protein ACM3JB_22265 [Acidobacteriaceae bacterium]